MERLCELALKEATPEIWFKMPSRWKWVGDFYLLGAPFNTVVSVKSFKAKERLLVSGSGNLLSPTIGFGLFDAPSEFQKQRLEQYKYRAFLAIYAPKDKVISQLDTASSQVVNINGNKLMRPIERLPDDLRSATIGHGAQARLNPTLL